MRRSDGFLIFSLIFTAVLFVIYRSPPILYLGLLYSMTVIFSRKRLVERELNSDAQSLMGILLIAVSPVFLILHFGEYPSPATFQALVLIGISLVFFEARSTVLPTSIAASEVFLAVIVRIVKTEEILGNMSNIFINITSILIRALMDLFSVPILMKGNVAVVRNGVVVIGSGCSGLDAFILYILAALLLIYLRRSSKREAALLLIGALGIIPLNAVRIFTLLVIGYYSGISFLELFHSHLGDLMFVVYVFAYWWVILKWKKGERKFSSS